MLLTILANLAQVDTGIVPPVVVTPTVTPSGGYPQGRYERRTRQAITRARKRLGISEEEEEIIEKIVVVQIEQPSKDEAYRKLELAAKLEEEGIRTKTKHYRMQAFLYSQLIDKELSRRLKQLQQEEDETIIRVVLSLMD